MFCGIGDGFDASMKNWFLIDRKVEIDNHSRRLKSGNQSIRGDKISRRGCVGGARDPVQPVSTLPV